MRRVLFALLFFVSSVNAGPIAEGFDTLCQKVLEPGLPENSFPYLIVRQSTSYTCGPACVKSAFRRFGVGHPMTSDLEFAGWLRTTESSGTSPEAIVNLFRHQGFNAQVEEGLDTYKLESYLAARHVVFALMNWKGAERWVLVVGMGPFSVFYMDPTVDSNHYLKMTHLDFMDYWSHQVSGRALSRTAVVIRTH